MEHRTISGELRDRDEYEGLFEYLRRKRKENQRLLDEKEERYWKLPSLQRIEYDMKWDYIKRDYHPFLLTLFFITCFAIVMFSLYLFQKNVMLARVIINFPWMILLVFGIDVLFSYSEYLIFKRRIRELNKRFGLINSDKRNISTRKRSSGRNSKRK